MEQISNEMPMDYAARFKYVPIIILAGFSTNIMNDLAKGVLASPYRR